MHLFLNNYIKNLTMKKKIAQLLMAFLTLSPVILRCQDNPKLITPTDFQIHIKKAQQPIKLDGELNEMDWQNAEIAAGFQVHYPQNGMPARFKTEAKVTYDDQFLYIAFSCQDSGKHIIQTLKRDVDYFESDGVSVVIDPTGQQINGFMFGVSPEGVQSEALITDDVAFEWDNKWFAEARYSAESWTAEMAIPFKTLRYDASRTSWKINFIRNDLNRGQYYTWTKIPPQFDGISLAYTGTLNWDNNPPLEKSNIALVPYTSGSLSKDYENKSHTEGVPHVGLDAKIALTSSLNLDATLNPDFSQIEVDEQVTNLTRFDIFYPEKRTFFLENSDVLGSFGIPPARPFFSRTIGLNENAQPVPILYGLRLSGNLTNKVRINVFNMHTKEKGNNLGQNFTAAAVQRSWGRSYMKLGFLNKQGFNKLEPSKTDYGRNALFSGLFVSKDNRLMAWSEAQHSFKHNIQTKNNAFSTGFMWQDKKWDFLQDFLTIGANYYADMGFINRIENYDALRDTVIRLGFKQNYNELNYYVRPQKRRITLHQLGVENFMVFNTDNSLNEWFDRFRYFMTFRNTSELKLRFDVTTENLPFPYSFSEDFALLQPQKYRYYYGTLQYNSDRRKVFSWDIRTLTGKFYNGNRTSLQGGIAYRAQPWGNFSIKFDWNSVSLLDKEAQMATTSFLIFSPKTEFNFSRTMSWTTWFQFNTQANNININSRFQWRYKPMSDLFVVYTDNYFAREEAFGIERFRPFQVKNRALVFKLSYWLNI